MPPNLEVSLTSGNYTSRTHSGWHQLSVKTTHPKEGSRRRELRRYENTLLEEGVQGLLEGHSCIYISGTMRWANKALIQSVTGNRGSNQTIINCDNWPRQWPNQLHSALVCWSIACAVIDGRQPSRQMCRGSVLPAPIQRDTHWVWGMLTFRTGEGLVRRGLERIHPAFSDLVSFPKSPLLPLFMETTFWEPIQLSFASSERNILGSKKECPHCIYFMRSLGRFSEIMFVEELIQAIHGNCPINVGISITVL